MAYRKAHGNGGDALARVETAPADELPEGVPAPAGPVPNRDASGRFLPGAGTSRVARSGGKAKAERDQLARLLGFADPPEGHKFHRYSRLAREWRDEHAGAIASTVGGGELSPGVSSIVASAALALAASRYLYDTASESGDPKLFAQASRLADQSRQSLLTAHELAAREAKARPQLSDIEQAKARIAAFTVERQDGRS